MSKFADNQNKKVNKFLKGETLEEFTIDDEDQNNFLILEFTSGSKLKIMYDYIYDIDIEDVN